ncbi:MAG: hypothetical protein ACD_12C00515G0004 [uncultured bacterium]|nr:MAG: hypothetical protein ACD_12C00515G0004 [uncultured bacterium]
MVSRKKIFLFLIFLLGSILILLGLIYFQEGKRVGAIRESYLRVSFLDIGQGDSILIQTPGNQDILIDGGPDNSVVDKLGRTLPFYDRDIELMILTHAHADHICGLVEVLKRYEVKQVLYSGKVDNNSACFLAWLDIIEEKNIPLTVALAGQNISLAQGLDMKILYPEEDLTGQKLKDLNDSSVVTLLDFKEIEFLFTGDAPQEIEEKLIEEKLEKVEVLKMGHHGSKYSTSEEFLDAINPEYAVIQSGQDNKYGHPHFITLRKLEKRGVEILRNDICGNIYFETDGEGLEVKSDKC